MTESLSRLPYHPDWIQESRWSGGKLVLQPKKFRLKTNLLEALHHHPSDIDKTRIQKVEQALETCWSKMQEMMEFGGGIRRTGKIIGARFEDLGLSQEQQARLAEQQYMSATATHICKALDLPPDLFAFSRMENVSFFAPHTHTKIGFNDYPKRRWTSNFIVKNQNDETVLLKEPTIAAFTNLARVTFEEHNVAHIVGAGTAANTFLYDLSFTTGLNAPPSS